MWLAGIPLALAGVLLVASLAVAIRLADGPADITPLARFLLGRAHLPVQVTFDRVTLAWRGLHDPAAPLIVAASGLRLEQPPATELAHVASVSLALALSRLLEGRFEPTDIAARDGAVTLRDTAPGTPPAPNRPHPAILRSLRRLDLDGIDVAVVGAAPIHPLTATAITAHLVHQASGPVAGHARARLAVGGAPAIALDATLTPNGSDTALALRSGPFDPTSLASVAAPLAAWHAPVTLNADVVLDRHLDPAHLTADLATTAAGTLDAPGSAVPIRAARIHLDATPSAPAALAGAAALAWTVDLASGTTVMPTPAPTLTGTAALRGDLETGGQLDGTVDLQATPVPIPLIGTWWPAAVARGGRQWVVKNLTAGTAADLAVHATLVSRDGAAGLSLGSIRGGFEGHGVDLWWLRPIDPIRNVEARLDIESADSLLISLRSGRQGKLDVAGSTMRITGLTAKDQPADIHARIKGPLPALLSLLAVPRLHLLSKQPLTLTDPSGTLAAELHVTLPLDDKVTVEQVGIGAHVDLAAVHLGDVALDHSIDDGRFTVDADQNGLALKGNAAFAGLPVALAIDLDFRAGPSSEVTEHVRATTSADGDEIRRASTSFGRILGGVASLSADYNLHRDKTANLQLAADLARASVDTPFGWSKRAGPPADLHADISFDHDRLAAIDNVNAHGPDLDIATHGLPGPHGPAGLAFDRVVIGRTRAAGRLDFPAPAGPGPGFHLALSGAELDLAALFASPTGRSGKSAPPPPKPIQRRSKPPPAQPWSADLAFRDITLANHAALGGVRASASGHATHIDLARATATAPVPATLTLARAPTGRVLRVDAQDAGILLSAFDLTDRISGGHLAVAATLPNGAPADGTAGTVHLDRFTLKRVPAVVLLLRDLTVYGLADPAPKPDITVSRVTVPFTWQNGVVTLDHASAWQPALGLTVKGTVDTDTDALDLSGTIVPAYALNTLPGRIPIVGKLFSPERGGGLFAATFSLQGPAAKPRIKVNPLAALLPGMLRDLLPH